VRELAERARQAAAALPVRPSWPVALAVAALLSGLLSLLFAVPPVYQVYVGDRHVAGSRHLAELVALVEADVARDLSRTVALTAGENQWYYSLASLGLTPAVDAAAALTEAAQLVPWWQRNGWSRPALHVSGLTTWDAAVLESAIGPVRLALQTEPSPARFAVTNREPVITPEVNGVLVETQAVLVALQGLGQSDWLEVPLSPKPPAVTRATLESMRIRKLVSQWTTQYDPTIPRAENVERAARAFNGLVIKPGEILSYNATVGPVDAANGWKEAYIIVSGELVPGVGGGVCQVATTFYGAALRANLEILERHPHQLAVTYIEPSQDAAIAQGWEDLKIRNTSPGYIYIETEAGEGRVTFRVYGDAPDGQEVRIESQILGSRPFTSRRIVDPALAPGQQVVKLAGHPGPVSEAYRLVYQDGELVKKELLSRDNYLPTTQVILTGPALP